MGRVIMLVVAAAVGFGAYSYSGSVFGGAATAIALFALWFAMNVRAGSVGLVKANIHAYFSARNRGLDHTDAILRVIASRYPFSGGHRDRVRTRLAEGGPYPVEAEEVKALVYIIFREELGGRPSADWDNKLWSVIDRHYDSAASQYLSVHSGAAI